MGTTNRRQSVSFAIPKSPDYKFLNITNFRGLDVSSNPFELATNTASDCLNVYVDETNTLTTRPRLEKKELKDGFGKDMVPLVGRCVGIYPLHDGYLFHWSHQMKILHGDTLTDVLVETMPLTPCKCFEQGDKIYLLGEGRYMVIDENGILNDVEGYVPTAYVTDVSGVKHKVNEKNILSPKYVDKWFWDIDVDVDVREDDSYSNNTFEKDENSKGTYGDGSSFGLRKQYSTDGDFKLTNIWVTYTINNETKDVYDVATLFPSLLTAETYIEYFNPSYNKLCWVRDHISGSTCCVYQEDGVWKAISLRAIAPGNYFLPISDEGYTFIDFSGSNIVFYDLNLSGNTFVETTISGPTTMTISFCKMVNDVFIGCGAASICFSVNRAELIESKEVLASVKGFCMGVTDTTIWSYTSKGFHTYDIKSGALLDTQQFTRNVQYVWYTPYYKNSAWFVEKLTGKVYAVPNINKINNVVYTGMTLTNTPITEPYLVSYISPTYAYFKYAVDSGGSRKVYEESFTKRETTEPTISVTRTITENNPEYEEWNSRKQKLLKSTLFTRFDNNYWFASGNIYFRSQNNDPTYFPITEYSELGDSNEDITGFNIANDTTLLAYKSNRLYLIQPFYSEATGMTEYSKTESKNTVGNTAIGAPIVTTLTETPIQINNDGIYGLSQVANVSAVERIADLMSEPINDRWLNEDDAVIEKAMTLNRLYWTYIILPYDKTSKVDPRDVAKIYLLDNRTNSWYYWELPIVVVNAFAKDNRAEFVDANGDIYYLTTTDIENKAFESDLVTDYYDAGKQLIPWYWQSQILPLGTMNYSKRLVNTTFILTDTDTKDGYGLNYSFKVFRKLASSTPETEISGDLNLVRSYTHKTTISKFGFLQMKISNIEKRDAEGNITADSYNNNKLRLVGLGLKYVLLEGLIK